MYVSVYVYVIFSSADISLQNCMHLIVSSSISLLFTLPGPVDKDYRPLGSQFNRCSF
jgi:hypothetical protein